MPKYEISEQDEEDFRQEKHINAWLAKAYPGRDDLLETSHINSKGNARSSNTFTCSSLEAPLSDGEGGECGTLADIIAGSDGRDLLDGENSFRNDDALSIIRETLACFKLKKEEIEWLIKLWSRCQIVSEMLFQTATIDTELESL